MIQSHKVMAHDIPQINRYILAFSLSLSLCNAMATNPSIERIESVLGINERPEFPANPPLEDVESLELYGGAHVDALHSLRNVNGRNIRKCNLWAKGPELAAQFADPIGQRPVLNLDHQVNGAVVLDALFQFDPDHNLQALPRRLVVHSVRDLLQRDGASSPKPVHH